MVEDFPAVPLGLGADIGPVLTYAQGGDRWNLLANLIVEAEGNATGWSYAQALVYNCEAVGCIAASAATNGRHWRCVARDCDDGFNTIYAAACLAIDCAGVGFNLWSRDGVAANCIAVRCGTGFIGTFSRNVFYRCVAYDSTGIGVNLDNGADAVRYLKQYQYSLIFVDLLMPRVDGWGVIDYVRSHRGTRAPRLFVVTGVQNQKLSAADQDVVTGLLYKPVDVGQIERIVAK